MQFGTSRRYSSPELCSSDSVERSARAMSRGCASSQTTSSSSGWRSPNYIEHPVSKMDTLAGIAIKYGVEVADIKRMNGLVTDLQMFALKSLRIPLPGRHPPSSASNGSASTGESSNGHAQTYRPLTYALESFQPFKQKPPNPKVSLAMKSLQGYYGLAQSSKKTAAEGTETAVYGEGTINTLDAEQLPKASPLSEPLLAHHRRSKSLMNGFSIENGTILDGLLFSQAGNGDLERSSDFFRWRQKADTDPASPAPELIMKEENTSGGLSGRAGKGLALRPKSASRTGLTADAEPSQLNPIPLHESVAIAFAGVRKSSSTSNLECSDNGTSSIWPTTKWPLKLDLQALSTAAVTRPIFDGLPKPITGKRNKAALD